MKNGVRIFDADTHAGSTAESLEPYLSKRVRELIPDLDSHRRENKFSHSSEPLQEPYRHTYSFEAAIGGWQVGAGTVPRVLGEAEPRENAARRAKFMGTTFPDPDGYEFAAARIKDMDQEGSDVHMMVSTPPTSLDRELETELIAAHHRWMNDFCAPYLNRLKSMIVCSVLDVDHCVEEIERWGPSPWAVAIHPQLPIDYPIDHPDLNPIWAAAQEHDLVLVHHSFSQGYPGYRDLWNNPYLGRSASHPWSAMRFVGAVTGSGILDRYPRLRFAILESGFGWLPFWATRLDEQAEYLGTVAEGLKFKPSEYLKSGRFFASIEIHEGADMMRTFVDLFGEDVLMMGSDYPHPESRFPESPDRVLEWQENGVSEPALQKLMWDNAVRCFGEP